MMNSEYVQKFNGGQQNNNKLGKIGIQTCTVQGATPSWKCTAPFSSIQGPLFSPSTKDWSKVLWQNALSAAFENILERWASIV